LKSRILESKRVPSWILKNTVLRGIFIEKKYNSHTTRKICTVTEYRGKENKKGRRKKE
jgi:hypothetical protein